MVPWTYFRRMPNRALVPFLVVLLAWVGVAAGLMIGTDQLELHQRINRALPAWADPFFVYGTHLADGYLTAVVALALLLRNWRSMLLVGTASLLSSFIVQFVKRNVFAAHRPGYYLDQMPGLRVPDGVELMHHFSFPSGHSTAAFALCLSLALLINQRGWAVALAVGAVLLAGSRVWISQHFTEDVVAGALLGVFSAWLMHSLLFGRWRNVEWLDRSPLRRAHKEWSDGSN